MFLEFLAAENLKNTIPAPLCRGMGHRVPPIPSGNRVAENLKNTIPAPLCRGMGHRVPPIPSGNRVLEFLAAENLKNTIPAPLCRGMGHRVPPIPSGNRVFGVFSCRKPQKHDSRPALSRDGASGPANSERESCFWSF